MTSCGKEKAALQKKIIPVKIMETTLERSPAVLNYVGMISSRQVKKLAFKSSGRISKVLVKKGDKIKSGQSLVELDTNDLKYSLQAAQGRLTSAQAQYNKAVNGAASEDISNAELNVKKTQDVYDYANLTYERMRILYESGAISRNDFEQATLELDIRTSELNQAKEVYNQVKKGARHEDKTSLLGQLKMAEADVSVQKSLLDDAVMKSDMDGFVIDVLFKEGELISAGMPAAVIRGESEIVNVGVSGEDIRKIQYGTKANIKVGDMETTGEVTGIEQTPDSLTRTYNVEITLDDNSFDLGSIAKVDMIVGIYEGIMVPITAVMSDGEDYVYIINNDIVIKRKIIILTTKGSNVMAEGISPGEKLVIEGMQKITDKDKVTIQ